MWTGTSLIAEVIGLIDTGRKPDITTAPETEEEWRKKILIILIQGRIFVILHNTHGKIESSALTMVLTAGIEHKAVVWHVKQVSNEPSTKKGRVHG